MADKPLTAFLNNVVKNGAVTIDQAQALNQLATPHLQFDAVLRLKQDPQQSIDALLKEVLENRPCNPEVSPAHPSRFMSNRRWVDIAVIAVAMPLVHMGWDHRAGLGRDIAGLFNSSAASALAQTTPPPSLTSAMIANPVFVSARHARPKTAAEAIHTMMDTTMQSAQPASAQSIAATELPTSAASSHESIDPTARESAEWNAQAEADMAAANAMPITSRR